MRSVNPSVNNIEKVWREVRHPITGKLIGKLCPQTRQLEVIDRGKRSVIELPPE